MAQSGRQHLISNVESDCFSDMENNPNLSAHEALESIGSVRSDLAERLVTPWFYHPILGLLMALLLLVYGTDQFDGSGLRVLVAFGVILASLGMAQWYARRTGIEMTRPPGPRSKRVMSLLMVGLVSPIVYCLIAEPAPVVVYVGAVAIFCFTVAVGRAYDAAIRADLCAQQADLAAHQSDSAS